MRKQRIGVPKKKGNTTVRLRKKSKVVKKSEIERDYQRVFLPHQLPYRGIYTEEDSLEQPSALTYVPSTTTTRAEV